jgi:hypothetical protein
MGTNCAALLADLFLYLNEAKFVQKLLQDKKQNQLFVSFNHTLLVDIIHSNCRLTTTLCDNRDDFDCIVSFPYLFIPLSPAYGSYSCHFMVCIPYIRFFFAVI